MDAPKVAIYLRLSRDDKRMDESESITNQRTYLQNYVQAKGWTVAEEYVDDGCSGTTFDRPGFQRMIKDIEKKLINVVVVKDSSRLGRDRVYGGYYTDVYFPQHNIRYISVNDNIDTGEGIGDSRLAVMMSAFNELYPLDISYKVRSTLTMKKKEGKFIGSSPPIGYLKDPVDKGRLVIDPVTAPLVRRIFHSYLECGSVIGVAKALTEQGIPTPSEYRQQKNTQKRFPGNWNDTMVRRILTNPTYAGHLTQNRAMKISYKVKKKINLPQKEWITIPNTHEAIINQDEFDRVQKALEVHSYHSQKGNTHLLTGIAFCADCGSPMTYVKESPTRTYMVCQGYRRAGRLRLCSSHCIRESYVEEAITDALREFVHKAVNQDELEKSAYKNEPYQQLQKQLAKAEQEIEDCRRTLNSLYHDKVSGKFSDAEFDDLHQDIKRRRELAEQQIEQLRTFMEQSNAEEEFRKRIREALKFDKLDRPTVLALIEKVFIHDDKEIEIVFRFRNPEKS